MSPVNLNVSTSIGAPNPRVVPNPDPSNPVISRGDDLTTADSFMKLMIEQLKNQDPMSPMQSNEFTQQLATLNSLQQLVALNQSVQGLTQASGLANASALIGAYVEGFDSGNEPVMGVVERVEMIDGQPTLKIGDKLLLVGQVLTVDDQIPDLPEVF
jgi:flagellar basal-body rod modification protein FlgD